MTLLLAFALALMLAVLISALTERTVLSSTVLFLAVGLVLGRGWLGALPVLAASVLPGVAELALFSVLFTDGMRAGGEAPPPGSRPLVARALGLGMPLTIAGIAAVAHFLLRLSWPQGLLLGAVLSPTDPIFVSALFAQKAVPARLRRLLNLESGINDGIALPFVILFLGAAGGRPEGLGVVALQLVAGIAIGVAIPWLGIRLEASRYFGASRLFQPLNAFALGLLVLALALRLDANIYLAAFAAGFSVARLGPAVRQQFEELGERGVELLKLAAIFIFGLEMAPGLFARLDWRSMVFVVCALFAVRMAALGLAMLGSRLSPGETLAAGWFGPKGFASVVYCLMILDLGTPTASYMAHLVGVTIALSIVVYSSTDILVARWFEKNHHADGLA